MKAVFEFQTYEQYQSYLRTYFAAMAMQGLVQREGWAERFNEEGGDKSLVIQIAYASTRMADELLRQLKL